LVSFQYISLSIPDIGLVISDWNMPNCTGLELLKKIRTDSGLKGLPFLLLTAETEVSQVRQAVAAGVDNYVLKPFTTESLQIKIEQVHARRTAAKPA
jgi:two-component system chemotaxis response regulator CheY